MPRGLLHKDGLWAEAEITREMLGLGSTPCQPKWLTFRLNPALSSVNHAITYIGREAIVQSFIYQSTLPCDNYTPHGTDKDTLVAIYAFDRNGVLVDWNPGVISAVYFAPQYTQSHTLVLCGRSDMPLHLRKLGLMADIQARREDYRHPYVYDIRCEQPMADYVWHHHIYIMVLTRMRLVRNGNKCVRYKTDVGNFWSVHGCMKQWGLTNLTEEWPNAYVYVSYVVNGCNADISRAPAVVKLLGGMIDDEDLTVLTSLAV